MMQYQSRDLINSLSAPKRAMEYGYTDEAEQRAYLEAYIQGQTVAQLAVTAILEQQRRYHEMHEPMTGLLNKKGMIAALETWQSLNTDKLIISFDCRQFKAVNDQKGHAVGDKMIKAVADALGQTFRGTSDTQTSRMPDILANVARVGGDEFVAAMVLSPKYTVEQQIRVIEERIRTSLEWLYEAYKDYAIKELGFGMTMGAAVWRGDKDVDEILEEADEQLLKNKILQKAGQVPQVSGILYSE